MLELKNISYNYYNANKEITFALQNISLLLKPKTLTCVIGEIGSGKSTLLLHLNGLLLPSSGEILLNDKSLSFNESELRQLRSSVGIMFQNPTNQLLAETVELDLKLGLSDIDSNKLLNILEEIGLPAEKEFLKKPISSLSNMQKRLLACASLLLRSPPILVLDEPEIGLDRFALQNFINILAKLKEKGYTLLITTHNLDYYLPLCNQILLLYQGQMIICDSPDIFFKKCDVSKYNLDIPERIKLMG